MNKEELLVLAEKFQAKADAAAENYQDSGMSRYGSAARRNEDIAEALRMAAAAADEHHEYIGMKAEMSNFAWRASMAFTAQTEDEKNKLMDALIRDLAAYGRMMGLIGGERR